MPPLDAIRGQELYWNGDRWSGWMAQQATSRLQARPWEWKPDAASALSAERWMQELRRTGMYPVPNQAKPDLGRGHCPTMDRSTHEFLHGKGESSVNGNPLSFTDYYREQYLQDALKAII